jgi:hypothetical protein
MSSDFRVTMEDLYQNSVEVNDALGQLCLVLLIDKDSKCSQKMKDWAKEQREELEGNNGSMKKQLLKELIKMKCSQNTSPAFPLSVLSGSPQHGWKAEAAIAGFNRLIEAVVNGSVDTEDNEFKEQDIVQLVHEHVKFYVMEDTQIKITRSQVIKLSNILKLKMNLLIASRKQLVQKLKNAAQQ